MGTMKNTAVEDGFALARSRMIGEIRAMAQEAGLCRPVPEPVLAVMAKMPRHLFIPAQETGSAYCNYPLPIGCGQTISQPYIVALMTGLLAPEKHQRVLEIGTGSGYQTAILAEMAAEVYSIEIVAQLAQTAAYLLGQLGYTHVHAKQGDGNAGWPEHAPYDGIIVTAAAKRVPEALLEQLKAGGRLVIPVGAWPHVQQLLLIEKSRDGGLRQETVLPVSFVPLVG